MRFLTGKIKFQTGDAFFFLMASLFIYTQAFQLPFTPIYFDGDALTPALNAMRMLDGEVIYRDFFHITTPGTELTYKVLFSLFGVKIWVLNLAIVGLGIGQIWLIWFLSGKVLDGPSRYLPAVIYLVIGFRQFGIDGSYRLFSMLFILAAIAVLIEKRSTRNLIIAGIMCGVASFFGQQRGILGIAAISGFLIWESYKNIFNFRLLIRSGLVLAAAFLVTVIVTQSYFLWQAGPDNYYFSMIGFARDHYRHDPLNNFGAFFSDLPNLSGTVAGLLSYTRISLAMYFYYALIPGIYLIFIIFWLWSKPKSSNAASTALFLLWFTGAIMAAGIAAPTATRLYHVAAPGLILLVWLVVQRRSLARLVPAALFVAGVIGTAYSVQRQTTPKYYLDMPAGHSAFLYEPTFEKYQWIGANTKPDDFIYEANHPNFYFPFHLRNPTPMPLIRDSEYTPAFQIDSVLNGLEQKRPQFIVWPSNWKKPADQRASDDHLEPLWTFVRNNYELKYVWTKTDESRFGDEEIWALKH